MHGHNYKLEIELGSHYLDEVTGFVMDFADVDGPVNALLLKVDHRLLNDIEGLQNPTAELIARWFFAALKDHLPVGVFLSRVTVYETDQYSATFKL